MRSQLRPTMFSADMEFGSKFEAISNKYAQDIILLNLDFLQKELTNIKSKGQLSESMLCNLIPQQEQTVYMENLNISLSKYRTEIEEVKKKKWHRDLNDYSSGKVYNCNVEKGDFTDRRPYRRRPRDSTDFDTNQ